ncbi:glycosyltransferase family 4 protein [Hymenobacter nivis]|uniref:Glycosyl transferase family 1 domain-containing protein n=1 Tax=Hymenobacter nivis TaxID=1850093 RepID=A0A2Z3GNR7_9BACT|nr:glycosyltransferase family 1 protein [Hymenobacter nivis]AWM34908.1 hypothetical protein DDQ68_20295 [Hymenobacter nivis]
MAKRKRIALIYAYNENWIGGTYYIENLIAALGQLPDAKQPELLIFSHEAADAERLQQAVYYPYWSFRRFERSLSLPERALNKLTSKVLGRRFISPLYNDIDLVFPLPVALRSYFRHVLHQLYWIPDFQEHYLPAFFAPEEIQGRKAEQQVVVNSGKHIVFSSHAAQHDFESIYPLNQLIQHVLQFAVTSAAVSKPSDTCVKYGIESPYFICSNQFWKHKNHPVVLRALAQLLQTHPQAQGVFTGKEYDHRNPTYYEELVALKSELALDKAVKFLGFIPRKDQVALMQQAVAVIQPSLFEGWSTVVEDAKALNTPLVVSDLKVHEEQLLNYEAKLFFSPDDASTLAHCMAQVLNGQLPARPYDYHRDVVRFGERFMESVSRILVN